MNYLIVANPKAGSGQAESRSQELHKLLQELKGQGQLKYTSMPGQAGEIVATFLQNNPQQIDTVIAVGGDGTLAETASGLLNLTGQIPSLAFVPAGTANCMASSLKLPAQLDILAQVIVQNNTINWDIGLAAGQPFLMCCGAGVDGEIIERLSKNRQSTGMAYWRYISECVRTLCYSANYQISWSKAAESELASDPVFGLVIVGNLPLYGNCLHFFSQDAKVGDARLDLAGFKMSQNRFLRRFSLLRHGVSALLGYGQKAIYEQINQHETIMLSSINNRAVPYQIDGNFGGYLPLEIKLHAQQIKLVTGG